MRLAFVIEAYQSLAAKLPQIEDFPQLSFKLGRIKDGFEGDVLAFNRQESQLRKKYGTQYVKFTSVDQLDGLLYLGQAEDKKTFVYAALPTIFEAIKNSKGVQRLDDLYIPEGTNRETFAEAMNEILATDRPITETVDIALFDGAKFPVASLHDIVVEE